MHTEPNATRRFGDECAVGQLFANSLHGVLDGRQQKAGGQLREAGARIEQSWRGVREPALGHQIVGLEMFKNCE